MAKKTIECMLRATKVTKNCVLYTELGSDNKPLDPKDEELVINRGTLYLTKAAIKAAGFKKAPKEITITIAEG